MSRVTVRVRRVEGSSVVAVRVLILGGSRIEETPGQAAVTGRMLAEGSRRRAWRQIAEQAENRGMAVWSFGGLESIGVAVDALSTDWRRAVRWSAELALEPSFPVGRCEWIRRQAAAELESQADQPEVRTAREFLRALYAPHPRSRPILGSAVSLAGLGPGDCRAHHAKALACGILVSVAGDVEEDEARREAEVRFGRAAGGGPAAWSPPEPVGAAERTHRVALGEDASGHLFLGHLTVPARHLQLPALELAAVILGAGPGLHGRLPLQLRESRGLAYVTTVDTAAEAGLDPGYLSVYVGTSRESLGPAERIVRAELERFVTEGPTELEVREARSYLLGREPFRRETARHWADLLARSELYGVPLDRPEWVADKIRELDRAQVHEAVRQNIRPEDLHAVIGYPGPAD